MWPPLVRSPVRAWLTTQACALTGTRTGDPLVRRRALSPLSHSSGGWKSYLLQTGLRMPYRHGSTSAFWCSRQDPQHSCAVCVCVCVVYAYVCIYNHTGAYVHIQIYIIVFRERGAEGGREREKHRCARDTAIVASHMPQLGTWPAPRLGWDPTVGTGSQPRTSEFAGRRPAHRVAP